MRAQVGHASIKHQHATNEFIDPQDFESQTKRYVRIVQAADRADLIVDAVNAYLSSWSRDRVRNLQMIDGGWGPFGAGQELSVLRSLGDVWRLYNNVHRQRICLGEANMTYPDEIVLLEQVLGEATRAARSYVSKALGLRHQQALSA